MTTFDNVYKGDVPFIYLYVLRDIKSYKSVLLRSCHCEDGTEAGSVVAAFNYLKHCCTRANPTRVAERSPYPIIFMITPRSLSQQRSYSRKG
jgi:hypothetical protein